MPSGYPLVRRPDRLFPDVHARQHLRGATIRRGGEASRPPRGVIRARRVPAAARVAGRARAPAWAAVAGRDAGRARDGQGAGRFVSRGESGAAVPTSVAPHCVRMSRGAQRVAGAARRRGTPWVTIRCRASAIALPATRHSPPPGAIMRQLVFSTFLSLLVVSTLPAQTRTIAERLGHPRDAKLLILHADDIGVAHSENAASFDAMDKGAINSGSVMMPTPWVTEVAEYAKRNPNHDLGLHLTLTSEWKTYRWGGVAPRDAVPSLYEPDGTLPSNTGVVAKRANLDEVERELRAQIDRAIAIGIKPTHVDSHMAALFETPELFRTYVKVARAYKLPFLHYIGGPSPANVAALTPNDIVPDVVIMALQTGTPEQWRKYYLDAIRNLKPGLTEILLHLGYDDAELRAVMVGNEAFGAKWRQQDYDVLTSAEFKQALKDNNVVLVTWRDIQKTMYPGQ